MWLEIFWFDKVHLEETYVLFYKSVHQSQNNNKIVKDDEILQTSMLFVKWLEQAWLLMTLSSATFTIKDKSQERKELIFNLYYCSRWRNEPISAQFIQYISVQSKPIYKQQSSLHLLSFRLEQILKVEHVLYSKSAELECERLFCLRLLFHSKSRLWWTHRTWIENKIICATLITDFEKWILVCFFKRCKVGWGKTVVCIQIRLRQKGPCVWTRGIKVFIASYHEAWPNFKYYVNLRQICY